MKFILFFSILVMSNLPAISNFMPNLFSTFNESKISFSLIHAYVPELLESFFPSYVTFPSDVNSHFAIRPSSFFAFHSPKIIFLESTASQPIVNTNKGNNRIIKYFFTIALLFVIPF